ncbi:MAG: erythromycin esterase family protein [Holophagales bacterium]|nr:erythromycin esterase family protein [Holophagales bacterium]
MRGPSTGGEAFAEWARANAHAIECGTPGGTDTDLEPLRAIIGQAPVVSFGEGLHGGAEPLDFRNRLFRFLVENLGFTAIAIESGITEGFEVNRWVLGGPGDLGEVVARGFTAGFDRMPQNVELVRWMREYNANPAHRRKVEFYGMDVPGSPDDMQRTLFVALDYLGARDAALAASLRTRIEDLVPKLKLDRRSDAPGQYTELDQAQRDRLTATVADVIAALAIHENEYARATTDRDFALAHRAAVAARQVDEYLRQLPIGWKPADGFQGLAGTVASADRAKADNVDWIRRQLGPEGRLLLFAHRDHLAGSMSTIRIPPQIAAWTLPPMVGMYLRRRYGKELVTIAHLFASEAIRRGEPGTRAAAGTIEARLAELPHRYAVLDLHTATPQVASWLATPHELFGVMPYNTTIPWEAWDAVFFSQEVGPAVP